MPPVSKPTVAAILLPRVNMDNMTVIQYLKPQSIDDSESIEIEPEIAALRKLPAH